MTEVVETETETRLTLSVTAARTITTTTKTVPQMQGISSRWLLKMLPWEQVSGGAYRVNRRLNYTVGDGRITFVNTGAQIRVVPQELREIPLLRDFDDEQALTALADRFSQQEYQPGDVLVTEGGPVDQLFLLAHGKVDRLRAGEYGDPTSLGGLADGDYFGEQALTGPDELWPHTVRAATPCTVLVLRNQAMRELNGQADPLREHIAAALARPEKPANKHGEAQIDLAAGHDGEVELPGTFVDYDTAPREYELSVAQTVLRIHTRVADLYNQPMSQVDQQLRLTIEALRERQEHELVNNTDFGLLNNADLKHRIQSRGGPPTPADMDDLLSRRRKTKFFLAHPRTIAAIGRECTTRGVYPEPVECQGKVVQAWRGVPILPCDKIPISDRGTSSIIAMRTGAKDAGVIGLHKTGIPDEYQPGLSVRFMGVDAKALLSYLVSAYYSAAVLVPDALGVLENVEITR